MNSPTENIEKQIRLELVMKYANEKSIKQLEELFKWVIGPQVNIFPVKSIIEVK